MAKGTVSQRRRLGPRSAVHPGIHEHSHCPCLSQDLRSADIEMESTSSDSQWMIRLHSHCEFIRYSRLISLAAASHGATCLSVRTQIVRRIRQRGRMGGPYRAAHLLANDWAAGADLWGNPRDEACASGASPSAFARVRRSCRIINIMGPCGVARGRDSSFGFRGEPPAGTGVAGIELASPQRGGHGFEGVAHRLSTPSHGVLFSGPRCSQPQPSRRPARPS